MAREQESHASIRKNNSKEAGDATAKKRGKSKHSSRTSEEEADLLRIAVKSMIEDIKSGKTKTYKLEDVLKEEDTRRGLR